MKTASDERLDGDIVRQEACTDRKMYRLRHDLAPRRALHLPLQRVNPLPLVDHTHVLDGHEALGVLRAYALAWQPQFVPVLEGTTE